MWRSCGEANEESPRNNDSVRSTTQLYKFVSNCLKNSFPQVLGGNKNRELHRLFDTLQGRPASSSPGAASSSAAGAAGGAGSGGGGSSPADKAALVPVPPARFQALHVDEKQSIKDFAQENGLIFKAGMGFYEFTKAETVSAKKGVVLVDRSTGDMFTGPEACAYIGAGGSGKIKPTALVDYQVFVQSTSYNRVLMGGTDFLYEVDPDSVDPTK